MFEILPTDSAYVATPLLATLVALCVCQVIAWVLRYRKWVAPYKKLPTDKDVHWFFGHMHKVSSLKTRNIISLAFYYFCNILNINYSTNFVNHTLPQNTSVNVCLHIKTQHGYVRRLHSSTPDLARRESRSSRATRTSSRTCTCSGSAGSAPYLLCTTPRPSAPCLKPQVHIPTGMNVYE